jgi:hypothetical protein
MDILKRKIIKNCQYEGIQEHNIFITKKLISENRHGDQYLIVYWCYIDSIEDDLVVEKIVLPLWGMKVATEHLDHNPW